MAGTTTTTAVRVPDAKQRFSWSSTLAGLVAALAVMLVLSVLGLAIGLSTVDRNSQASNYGIGAGIWGGASALIAFFVGGLIAAWSGAGTTSGHGAFQGALAWALGIVVLGYVLAGGVGAVARTAGSAASTGIEAASNGAGQMQSSMTDGRGNMTADAKATTQQAAGQIQAKVDQVKQQMTPQNMENAAGHAAGGTWGTLGAMVLTLGASIAGGFLGGNTTKYVTRVTRTT